MVEALADAFLYVVTNPVVSQVNPHVHLFFFSPRGSAGKPVAHRKGKASWRGNFLLSAAEQWLKHELTKNFKVIRDLELLPQLLGQDWSSVFLQRFDGAVTIWPRTRLWDWFRLLSDPDPPELERMMRIGQLVTWPKLHMIENRMKIEKQIFLGRRAIRKVLRSTQSHIRPSESPTQDDGIPDDIHKHPSLSAGSDHPLSVDTEVEAAFSRGSRWFFKKGRGTPTLPSGRSVSPAGAIDSSGQPRRSYEAGLGAKQRMATSAGGILSRFPGKSFLRFPLSTSEKTREGTPSRPLSADLEQERAWSSESSSETIDERRLSQFSLIPGISTQDLPTVDCQSNEEDE